MVNTQLSRLGDRAPMSWMSQRPGLRPGPTGERVSAKLNVVLGVFKVNAELLPHRGILRGYLAREPRNLLLPFPSLWGSCWREIGAAGGGGGICANRPDLPGDDDHVASH